MPTERVSDETLAELLELEAKATKAPWNCCGASGGRCQCGVVFGDAGIVYVCSMTMLNEADPCCAVEMRKDNAAFIPAARNHIRAFCLEVKERRAAEESQKMPGHDERRKRDATD